MIRTQYRKPALLGALSLIALALLGVNSARIASATGTVTVTGVAVNHSSVTIYFDPVSGARDYRVYDAASPNSVKYAGLVHIAPSSSCPGPYCLNHFVLQSDGVTPAFPYQIASGATGGPQVIDVAATQIEWNNAGDGAWHTLVVEAVDQLGPVPQANLYTGPNNLPLVGGTGMLGSNKGTTADGKTSTNGQGPYTNNPQVIAQSRSIPVQANSSRKAVPSTTSATQIFYDTFENSENATIRQVARDDNSTDSAGNLGMMTYTMNAGTSKAWTIEYRQADNANSMPFIAGDHFMDMLFDGATPGNSHGAPTHTIYGSMAMTPDQTINIATGQVLHMTMEVDGHQSFRRWVDFNLAPAADPLQSWDFNGHQINNADRGIFLELKDGFCTLDVFTNRVSTFDQSPTGTAGGDAHGARLWGQPGSTGGGAVMCDSQQMRVPNNFTTNGRGLDDKSRYDFFISQDHAALFQDGVLIVQSDIPAGTFPWVAMPLKAYYTHYLYHSDADVGDLRTFEQGGQTMCYPLNAYWFNDPALGTTADQDICHIAYPPNYGFPSSDERHWDNMGFEVLQASDVPVHDFSSLAALVQPPAPQAAGVPPSAPTQLRVVGLFLGGLFPQTAGVPSWFAHRRGL